MFFRERSNRILLGFVAFALVAVVSVAAGEKNIYRNLAQGGMVDLSEIRFGDRTEVVLDGTWHFWEGELLDPGQVEKRLAVGEAKVMSVPGVWSKLGIAGSVDNLRKTGTLALEMKLPAGDRDWAIRLSDAESACRLYANGKMLGQIGVVSADPHTFVPGKGVDAFNFSTTDGKALVVLQVANYAQPLTGTWNGPRFGTARGIPRQRNADMEFTAFISGAMIFMGLYHLALYLLRRKDKSALVFALICLFMSVRDLIMGERILMAFFPATYDGWRVAFVVEHLSVHMCVALFYVFFRLVFPDEMRRGPVWVAVGVCAVWAALEIFTPPMLCHRFLPYFEYFVGIASLYAVFVTVLALVHKREGSAIILAGLLLMVATVINDILLSNGVVETRYLTPFGMFLFSFAQAFFLSRRSANLFAAVEHSVSELSALNKSLERFIPKEMLDFLGKASITDVKFGDYTEARMTVFFLDIRNFTARSERMTPEATFRYINSFLEEFGPFVRANGGFIDKYLGDGFMAIFSDGPDSAFSAALSMRARLESFNRRMDSAGHEPLRFGIGIHTGVLMLGTIGENLRMDTTVISDTVNTASRLEELNKEFGTDILVSGDAVAALENPERFLTKLVSQSQVKGKAKLVDAFALLGVDGQ
jgi:class 3 adenylate cyclase